MSDLYSDLQTLTSGLLKQFRQGTIEYVELTPGSGPIDEPGPAVETVTTLDGAARGVAFKYVQGGLASSADLQATVAVPSVPVRGSGFIRVDGVRYKIKQILPKPAAGTPVSLTLIFGN